MSSPPLSTASFDEARSPAVIDTARRVAALALASVGASLARLAVRLQQAPTAKPDDSLARLEFHCEAGAPEGALYLDGRLVARIQGVQRL